MAERLGRDTVHALHTTLMAASHTAHGDITRVPVQMSFRLATVRWSRRFHPSPARRGRQQTTRAPSSRLGARAPGSALAKNFSENGWIASSSVCVDVTMRRFACLRLSSYIQPELQDDVDLTSQTHFSSSSGPFADDDGP